MRVVKILAGTMGLKRIQNDAVHMAGIMILCFVISIFVFYDVDI